MMSTTKRALIQKYDVPGPRYTSYPPVPHFTSEFGPNEYEHAIRQRESQHTNSELSLYVHIPFCYTLCYFCGCTTVVTRNRERVSEYVEYLQKEISLLASHLHQKRKVVQLHWGGGTPTYLTPMQIYSLMHTLRENFTISADAEVSVEVDPRDLTYEHVKMLHQMGFNRVSLGVQDFDPRVQGAVNRNQSEFVTRQAIEWIRELGFTSLNIDLIYGLPLQSVSSFAKTLEKITEIFPDRITAYNFAYVPKMKPHQKLIHVEDLPSPETKLEILTTTIGKLSEAGYVYIGMDHFAKPDDELAVAQREKTLHRNFQGYSTKAGADLYGLGMSAISHFGPYYAQNAKTLQEYYQALDAGSFATQVGYTMSFDDEVRKFVIMRLMCNLLLEKGEVERKFGICFDSYFGESLATVQPLVDDGLVISNQDVLQVTKLGRLFLRNIAMCFDAYLNKTKQQQPLYSKTV